MGKPCTLAFYITENHYSYKEAEQRGAVQSVHLDCAEAHKGLAQSAVYDAIVIIDAVKRCFSIDDPLTFVLLDENNNLIDAG
jgi:hypothetical protein